MGDADFVYPPLRRGSRKVSYSNPEMGRDRTVRKTGDAGEGDRVEVWQVRQRVRHDAGSTNYF